MRRALACGVAFAAMLAMTGSGRPSEAAAVSASSACPAARVHHEPNELLGMLSGGRWIAGSPSTAGIFGYLFGGEEVDGRIALYAGGVNPVTGHNEKILWILRQTRIGELRIVGRRVRVTPSGRVVRAPGSFRLVTYEASAEQTPGHIFPSIVAPPRAGCWRLTLRSGTRSARLIIRALPATS